jgi:hypothetical protein
MLAPVWSLQVGERVLNSINYLLLWRLFFLFYTKKLFFLGENFIEYNSVKDKHVWLNSYLELQILD